MGVKGKTNSKLVITKQEKILLRASNEAKDTERYGNLYSCLEEFEKLSRVELDSNIAFDDKARAVLINLDNKKVMMNNIFNEWYAAKYSEVADKEVRCQLCGRRNRFVFYIHNKITGEELHIGSDCVNKFSDIEGMAQQKKSLSKLKHEQEMQRRKIEFEIKEKDDVEFISRSEECFNNFPVLLPINLYNKLKELIKQLNLVKSSYIKSGGNLDEAFEKYLKLKKELQNIFYKAEEHYERVKNNVLVCTKDTADWLTVNYHSVWEKVAKNGGLFSVETLKDVYYDKYLTEKLNIIKRHIADKDIKIISIDKTIIKFVIDNNRYKYPIVFSMTIKKFMATVGCYCLTDEKYKFGKMDLQDIAIEVTWRNFEALYNSVLGLLGRNGYDFIIDDKTKQAYWKKLSNRERIGKWHNNNLQIEPMYKKSNIKIFVEALAPFLLKDEEVLEKSFAVVIQKMESGQRWMTQKEKNESDDIVRQIRGMQRQREFIPY